MMSIEATFDALAARVLREVPGLALPAGATDAGIDELERFIGLPLPEDLRRLYRLHDGEFAYGSRACTGLFGGYEFLSLRHVRELIVEQMNGHGLELRGHLAGCECASVPPGCVDGSAFLPGWIPFAGYFGGYYLGVDLAPGPSGVRGQVINFGPDDFVHFQIAPTLEGFLELVLCRYRQRRWHPAFEGPRWSLYGELKDGLAVACGGWRERSAAAHAYGAGA